MAAFLDAFSGGGRRGARRSADEHDDHHEPLRVESPRRDPKKLFLVVGLGALSWVATYVGMLELIEANLGDLPLVHKVIIGFSVAMLMTMIVWLLDQMFAPIGALHRACLRRRLRLPLRHLGRVRLRLLLEGAREPRRGLALGRERGDAGAERAATPPPRASSSSIARWSSLTTISTQKAEQERASGKSCPNSEARRRAAPQDARGRRRAASSSPPISSRGASAPSRRDMAALDGDLAEDRQGRPVDDRCQDRHPQRVHARRRPQARPHRDRLQCVPHRSAAEADPHRSRRPRREDDHSPTPRAAASPAPTRSCRGRCAASCAPSTSCPSCEKPTIAAVEGSEATIEAFRRLTTTLLRPALLQAAAVGRRAARAAAEGRAVGRRSDVAGRRAKSLPRPSRPACPSATTCRSPSPSSSTSACCWSRSAGR